MTAAQLKLITYGIKIKLKRGEELETILSSYVKLTDEEKETIRNSIEN